MDIYKYYLYLDTADKSGGLKIEKEANYFTCWLIDHKSGYSYIISCNEADKNRSRAKIVDKMIGSIEYLSPSPTKEKAPSLPYYDFTRYIKLVRD